MVTSQTNSLNSSHRFSQCAWRTIKEYAGIYGALSASEMRAVMDLPADQIIELCVSSTKPLLGVADNGQTHARNLYKLRTMQNTKIFRKWRARGNINAWHQQNFIDKYYTEFFPDAVRAQRDILVQIGRPVCADARPCTFMPKPRPTGEQQETIDLQVFEENISLTINAYTNEERKRRALVCKHIAQAPNRGTIYSNLKKAVANPMEYCACGHLVRKDEKSLRKHQLTKRHLKGVTEDCNLRVVDQWNIETGEWPPGFVVRPDAVWHHWVGSADIATQMVNSTANGGVIRHY